MSDVDVSVVIPTFRRERHVLEAVQSALGQPGPRLEVIVVDDSPEGSARGGIEAIGDPRVRYVRRREHSGGRPALPRNEGAALARGRYVHFLDDDDRLAGGALAALVGALDADPQASMAFGTIEPFGDDDAELRAQQAYFARAARLARSLRGRMHLTARLLFRDTLLVNSACTARRDRVAAAGGYDPSLPLCEDVELYARLVRAGGYVYVDRPVVHYRTGDPSLMNAPENRGERLHASYRRMHAKYREAHGAVEFYSLKVLARAM